MNFERQLCANGPLAFKLPNACGKRERSV